MTIRKIMLTLSAMVLAIPALAASTSTGNASQAGGNAAIEVALKACASQVSADSSGKPDRTAFDACMKAKGFEKPSGPPPGERGGPKGPPPQ